MFAQDQGNLVLDRGLGAAEFVGDFLVGEAGQEQLAHALLGGSQVGIKSGGRRRL